MCTGSILNVADPVMGIRIRPFTLMLDTDPAVHSGYFGKNLDQDPSFQKDADPDPQN